MSEQELDVTAIGNAIVDMLSQVDDGLVLAEGFAKGSMTLIDAERALSLCDKLRECQLRCGGSAGNTVAGLAALGSRGGYIGKVAADDLGRSYAEGMRATGVEFSTPPVCCDTPTARCVVLVTPDAQRTLCTYLGACVKLGPEDVDASLIRRSRVTYLEGYLWDPPAAKQAFLRAADLAHEAGRKVALSLSDPFCVERHREEFRDLVARHVDILFGNEAEILALVPGGVRGRVVEHGPSRETQLE